MSFKKTIPHFKQAVTFHLHYITKAKSCISYGHQSKVTVKSLFYFNYSRNFYLRDSVHWARARHTNAAIMALSLFVSLKKCNININKRESSSHDANCLSGLVSCHCWFCPLVCVCVFDSSSKIFLNYFISLIV